MVEKDAEEFLISFSPMEYFVVKGIPLGAQSALGHPIGCSGTGV